jgi:hypothetical protein
MKTRLREFTNRNRFSPALCMVGVVLACLCVTGCPSLPDVKASYYLPSTSVTTSGSGREADAALAPALLGAALRCGSLRSTNRSGSGSTLA